MNRQYKGNDWNPERVQYTVEQKYRTLPAGRVEWSVARDDARSYQTLGSKYARLQMVRSGHEKLRLVTKKIIQ